MAKSWPTIVLSVLLLRAAAICAADGVQTYRDREYGFSFEYPVAWSAQPGIGTNTRVVITSPANQRDANCNVVVRNVTSTASQAQLQLNRGLGGKEFEHDY